MTTKRTRTLGSVLRAKREALGLSATALAKQVDLAPSSVTRLERDEIGATDDTVRRLAKALKASYSELATLAGGTLPNFAPYLRAKYDLDDEAVAELEQHFKAVSRKATKRGQP